MKQIVSAKLAVLAALVVACSLTAGCSSKKDQAENNSQERSDGKKTVGTPVQTDQGLGERYVFAVLRCSDLAKRTESETRLRALHTAIVMYQQTNGDKLPASLSDLVQKGLVAKEMTTSPTPDGGEFTYVAGLKSGDPADSVLACDAKIIYMDRQVLLQLDGAIVFVKPEDLDNRLSASQKLVAGR